MKISNIFATKQDEEVARILEKINLFHDLTITERTKIAKYFQKKIYNAKDVIINEGEVGECMYVIKEGAVKVVKNLPTGESQVLSNLVDGDFFGEMALIEGTERSASVIAVTKVDMLELYRVSLIELTKNEPKIAVKILWNLAKTLSHRIRQAGDKIKDILMWQSLKK